MARLEANDLRVLLATLRIWFEAGRSLESSIGDELRSVSAALDGVGNEPSEVRASEHPLVRYLPAALEAIRTHAPEVACILGPVAGRLPWRYGYQPTPDAPGLENAMGWAELVGPEAPFRSGDVCFGLTLIGPASYYPPHYHPAMELYRILAGHAEWTLGAQTATQPPGAYILHAANVVHAMRTGPESLLAIYSWTGDVVSPSVWAGGGLS